MCYRSHFVKGLCIFLCAVVSLCAVSCGKEKTGNLERKQLFSIKYGNFEDQLDLFQLASPYVRPDSQLFMDDGIFYLSNSGAGKILKLTSFGDLLALYYNPEKNPRPTFIDADQADKIMTRLAVPYPLNHPTYLAVTPNKHLFAVDTVNEERIEYDQTANLVLRDTVIHFNEAGDFVDTVGQEGVGGTPFPPIEGLYADAQNGIIVVCRTEFPLCLTACRRPIPTKSSCFPALIRLYPILPQKSCILKLIITVKTSMRISM